MYKNGTKMAGFPALIDLKIAKNTDFYLEILNTIYTQDIFEEYFNFNIFTYLRRCGVIPV
jgi:hypothetical protein